MININSNTVAVETSAELKTVLESDNDINLIYLAKDITLAQGITVLGTKTEVIIDGLYPTDGTGIIHTYTDMNSASSADTIGIRSTSSIKLTVQNLNVVGKNYYGLIFVSEGTAHQNVVITYKNITYEGPQITYHPSGLSIYQDLSINIVDSTACVANEVAEAGSIQIGGTTTIIHNSNSNSTFWFRGSTNTPYLEILENSIVSITTSKDIAYSTYYLKLLVNKNSSFKIKAKSGFFRDNSHQSSSVMVDENSILSIIQSQANGSNATLTCRGEFIVNKDATLYMEANYQNTAPLTLFNTSSSKFNINSPKSIIMYNKTNSCLLSSNTANLTINCGKIDYWLTSPQLINTGIIENNPLYSWYKSNEENILLTATLTSSKTTLTSNNLTDTEKEALPSLDLLSLQTAKTLRFVEMGNLNLINAPSTIEFERPIISSNPLLLGRKGETLTISVIDSRAISTKWYLYVYIDKPLTSEDEKYILNDSLVFIEANNEIKTLGKTPTLIYAGDPNDGSTKTTDIVWNKTDGILFQVIDPLHNGKKYTTSINWILTDKEI